MPERGAERGDDRRPDGLRRVGRPDDERPITLSGILGETPEEASRRPAPPPPALKGSPARSLLLVGFSAVVVACLVALGALATHPGGFIGLYPDRQTAGLSDGATSDPADLTPDLPAPGAPRSEETRPGFPRPGGKRSGDASAPGAGPRTGVTPAPDWPTRSDTAHGGGAAPGYQLPGAAAGSAASDRAGSNGGSDRAGSDRAGSDKSGWGNSPDGDAHRAGDADRDDRAAAAHDRADRDRADRDRADRDRADRDPADRDREERDRPASEAGSSFGHAVLDTVNSVLRVLTDGGPRALDVQLTDSWHDASGHDHSGRRGDHPGVRAEPAGIASGIRLPGR